MTTSRFFNQPTKNTVEKPNYPGYFSSYLELTFEINNILSDKSPTINQRIKKTIEFFNRHISLNTSSYIVFGFLSAATTDFIDYILKPATQNDLPLNSIHRAILEERKKLSKSDAVNFYLSMMKEFDFILEQRKKIIERVKLSFAAPLKNTKEEVSEASETVTITTQSFRLASGFSIN